MKCDDKKLYNFTICTQIFTLHIGFDGLRHICRIFDRVADGYDVPAAVPQALKEGVCIRDSYKLPPESNSGKEEWGRWNPGRRKTQSIKMALRLPAVYGRFWSLLFSWKGEQNAWQ